MEEKLVLVVSKHHRFGWKFVLFWVRELNGGCVEILGAPNAKEAAKIEMPTINFQLIKLIDEVSDTALMKAYSQQKNLVRFLNEVSPETIDKYIRPRIEINIRKVIPLAEQSALPIYLRDDMAHKTLSDNQRITILPTPSNCLFNFVKDTAGLRYFISLTNEDREFSLQSKPVCVLSQEPCIVLLGNEIHRVANIDIKKLIPFFDKTHIAVPASAEKKYIETFIMKSIPKYEVKIEGIEMKELTPSRKAVLTLDEDFYQQPVLLLHFHYNQYKINPVLRKIKFVELADINGVETICQVNRDMEWETLLINKLFDMGLVRKGDNSFYLQQNPEILQHYGLIDWLNTNRKDLGDFTVEQRLNKTFYTGTITLQSKIDIKIDWFELYIDVVFDHFSIPFSRFRKHILNGNIEFILPDKSVFILPEIWFHRYRDLFMFGKETAKGIRLSKMHIGILNDSIGELFPEKTKQKLQQYRQLPDEQPVPSPHLNTLLRPYQREGFYWLTHLHNNGLGGCLADDMGLGKTLQVITTLDYVYAKAGEKEILPAADGQLSLFALLESTLPASLIVAPKSLLHNWQNELKKFKTELNVYVYAGNNRIKSGAIEQLFNRYQIIITSYSILRADIEYLKEYAYHYIILDESQYIKNPDSILYKSVKKLYAPHKLVMTGTPIENSLSDLWAQFNFINPGLLGNASFFRNHFLLQITKDKNKAAEERLQQLIQPFFLRRTKEEVAQDLPPLLQEVVFCDMTESQREIYDVEKNRIRNVLLENKDNPVKNNFIALQGLMRLRMLSNHPSLVDANYSEDSGKFDQIMLYVDNLRASGHKVLIFSSFVKHLKLLSSRFDREGRKYAMLTGQTSNREEEINKFIRHNDVNCFLITLKAGGTGLNLTAADYVFIIDPWWNPAAEMQALSRAHRIGQDKKVIVYRFISSDSIEEKIMILQQQKIKLFDTFIFSNNPMQQLAHQEIESLFL